MSDAIPSNIRATMSAWNAIGYPLEDIGRHHRMLCADDHAVSPALRRLFGKSWGAEIRFPPA